MAAAFYTLLDLLKTKEADASIGVIEEAVKECPEVRELAARTINGIKFKTLVRTGVPVSLASFRNINEGVEATKSSFENRETECFNLESRLEVDCSAADEYPDGAEAFIALDHAGRLAAELQGLGRQMFYGRATNGNSKGFPGLINAYDSTNMVVDATGTTEDVASSVWLVRQGPLDVQWVWGLNRTLDFMTGNNGKKVWIENVAPNTSSATKKAAFYVSVLKGRPGLMVGSTRSICRIKKLTTDSGKGLTDSLINQAFSKMKGQRPTHIFMSYRSLEQLRGSRTATNQTGSPAPTPTEVNGVPIYPTESILDTEKLAS